MNVQKASITLNTIEKKYLPAYPSPNTSCPTSPLLFKPELKIKKRKNIPFRSVKQPICSDEKYIQGIISLNVYHVYSQNPRLLLGTPIQKVKKDVIVPCKVDLSRYKNTQGAPVVVWKKGMFPFMLGGMLHISPNQEKYSELTPEEIKTCSILRMTPCQYLNMKETILSQVETRGPFKKRDAKSWFRIDVNKTAILFDWFRSLGWIPNDDEWTHQSPLALEA